MAFDPQTLEMLVDELFETANWYGVTPNSRIGETFALGYVAARRQLNREQVDEFRRAVNVRLQKDDQRAMIENLIQSAITSTN